ncbi:MAG: hypothetical protein RL367_707, partial [Pseudomonadota bacterium]
MRVGIIGAGIAGLACADVLAEHGHQVALFDKARGAGGRMSTRRVETGSGEVAFDFGAQYFTARDPGFKALVAQWHRAGLVLPWVLAGADAWIGLPGMNAVVKAMADNHEVTWTCLIKGIVGNDLGWHLMNERGSEGPFDAVVIAIPAEQAAAILALHDFDMARIALLARSQPCWTGMFAFAQPVDTPMVIVRNHGITGWAARNSAKPGRGEQDAWVVQATGHWSQANLDAATGAVCQQLLESLSDAIGATLPPPVFAQAHRWRYALSAGTGHGALWNETIGLGVCGDWLLGPRVECAWLSG